MLEIQITKSKIVPVLSAIKLHSCELVVFIDMNRYILTEDRDFKKFLK